MSRIALIVALLLLSLQLHAREASPVRLVSFKEFMQETLDVDLHLQVPVPIEYEPFPVEDTPDDSSYWMTSEAAERVLEDGSLPNDSGYMFGKMSMNVAFDPDSGVFDGLEDARSIAEAKKHFAKLSVERISGAVVPAVLVSYSDRSTGKVAFSAYLYSGIEAIVVHITLRPRHNESAVGRSVWKRFRAALLSGSKSIELPNGES